MTQRDTARALRLLDEETARLAVMARDGELVVGPDMAVWMPTGRQATCVDLLHLEPPRAMVRRLLDLARERAPELLQAGWMPSADLQDRLAAARGRLNVLAQPCRLIVSAGQVTYTPRGWASQYTARAEEWSILDTVIAALDRARGSG